MQKNILYNYKVMATNRTIFQKLNESPDSKLIEIMFKLFKTHKLNYGMINKAYDMYLNASNKENILEKLKTFSTLLSGKELSELFELSLDDIFDIFKVKKDGQINTYDFAIFFEKFKIYKMTYVFSNVELCEYVLQSVSKLNDIVKEKEIGISKTLFYKIKSAVLQKMYNLGYMTDCHKEVRDDETFFSISFSINGNLYHFHQKPEGFFSTIKEANKCEIKEFKRTPIDVSSVSDKKVEEMVCLLKYIYAKYLKYPFQKSFI